MVRAHLSRRRSRVRPPSLPSKCLHIVPFLGASARSLVRHLVSRPCLARSSTPGPLALAVQEARPVVHPLALVGDAGSESRKRTRRGLGAKQLLSLFVLAQLLAVGFELGSSEWARVGAEEQLQQGDVTKLGKLAAGLADPCAQRAAAGLRGPIALAAAAAGLT